MPQERPVPPPRLCDFNKCKQNLTSDHLDDRMARVHLQKPTPAPRKNFPPSTTEKFQHVKPPLLPKPKLRKDNHSVKAVISEKYKEPFKVTNPNEAKPKTIFVDENDNLTTTQPAEPAFSTLKIIEDESESADRSKLIKVNNIGPKPAQIRQDDIAITESSASNICVKDVCKPLSSTEPDVAKMAANITKAHNEKGICNSVNVDKAHKALRLSLPLVNRQEREVIYETPHHCSETCLCKENKLIQPEIPPDRALLITTPTSAAVPAHSFQNKPLPKPKPKLRSLPNGLLSYRRKQSQVIEADFRINDNHLKTFEKASICDCTVFSEYTNVNVYDGNHLVYPAYCEENMKKIGKNSSSFNNNELKEQDRAARQVALSSSDRKSQRSAKKRIQEMDDPMKHIESSNDGSDEGRSSDEKSSTESIKIFVREHICSASSSTSSGTTDDEGTCDEVDRNSSSTSSLLLNARKKCEGEAEESNNNINNGGRETEAEERIAYKRSCRSPTSSIMERCVPAEYTSSPIVDILASSVNETHPRPPSWFDLSFGRRGSPLERRCKRTPPINGDASAERGSSNRCDVKTNSLENRPREREVSLLEKIVRTHPIWYLQHIGRSAATHLLRSMEEGAFIVRGSSKPNSMALSIRLPAGLDSDTDHYLIESIGPGQSVRLESSPNSFKSLPLLIEHYCINGEELQTNLTLPSAIRNCRTTMQLQSLALMGQDFWTSEISQRRSVSRSSQTAATAKSLRTFSNGAANVPSKKRSNGQKITHSGTSCTTGSVSRRILEAHNNSVKREQLNNSAADCSNTVSTVPLSPTTQHLEGSMPTSSSAPRKSFLKNLFFGDPPQIVDTKMRNNPVGSHGVNSLAHCDVFSPIGSYRISGSQSAFALSRTDYECYQQRATTSRDWSIAHPTPSLRTFKPKKSTFMAEDNSQENVRKLNGLNLHSNVGMKPAVKPKPLALRRERSDLSASSVVRLAHYAEHSPGPPGVRHALVPPSSCLDERALRSCLEELKRKRDEAASMNISPGRQQRTPSNDNDRPVPDSVKPSSILRSHNDNNARNDQHRLSVPNLADLSCNNATTSAVNGITTSAKALTAKLGRNPGTGELQTINEGLITPVVRRKQYQRELPTEIASTSAWNQGISQKPSPPYKKPAKEFFHDRSCDDDLRSETGAVVEHSFTRRFHSERHSRERISPQRSVESSSAVHAYAWRPALQQNNGVKKDFVTVLNQRHQSPSTRHFSPSRTTLANKPNAAWSAINSELKNRQKIAKVRPTPQSSTLRVNGSTSDSSSSRNRSPRTMTVGTAAAASPSHCVRAQASSSSVGSARALNGSGHVVGRSSEYAQLVDCIELQHSSQNPKEDDNVSVAGTVFNEPWDSNVWENLLDLAHYGDEKPSTMKGQGYLDANMTSCLDEPIAEEEYEDEIACSLDISFDADDENNTFSREKEDRKEYGDEYGTVLRKRDASFGDSLTASEIEARREGIVVLPCGEKNMEAYNRHNHSESSSKSSTCGSRKDVSNSMMNVSQAGALSDGAATIGSRKTLNSHSLPRVMPRYSKVDETLLESLDDIPTSIRALSPIISPPRLKNNLSTDPGTKIQEYVERLSREENTVFGATLRRFIECTIEGEESDPQIVIRNVRQFLNGIKNYLVKHGEGELLDLIEKERTRLNANEFLNIDAILEAVLHKIVLGPVKPHLYHLMVREHSKNGWLQSLSENLHYVRTLTPEQLGFGLHGKFTPPTSQKMEAIKICLRKMQHHYSPLKKLENLLRVIFLAIGHPQHTCETPTGDVENFDPTNSEAPKAKPLPPADELVRWLVYLLARTSTVGCEVEAWYMWELLPKQLLTTGDSSYYLIALFSAVDVLKNTESIRRLGCPEDPCSMEEGSCSSSAGSESPVLATSDAFVRVAIPDELDGSIRYHTFPGVAQMTAGKLCRVIAHQFGITNPEDHGLYLLVDGYETCLLSNESPDMIRHQLRQARKAHLFAYKRHEAKIAWPKVAVGSASRS